MRTTVRFLVCILSASMLSIPAFAVDDIGVFEMDGNAVVDDTLYDYEDWETFTLPTPPAPNAIISTPILHDHGGLSVFEGGRKDILDISSWRWKVGSVPDKDDITHAYAAAYRCPDVMPGTTEPPSDCDPGDLIVYFGADRYSNSGDAYLGFWFFKSAVSALPDGTFSGVHQLGDALVLVNFPQGSNASPEIRVVEWDPDCMKGVKNPQDGECIAKNLRLVYEGVVCTDPNIIEDYACAVTNTESDWSLTELQPGTVMAPWDYQAKSPDPGCLTGQYCLPYESFFEGGINLSQLFEDQGSCFASFMVESRSSSEFTATLKDFVLHSFPLCAVELSKSCDTGAFVPFPGSEMVEIPFNVTVRNTGMATVSTIELYDDLCGLAPDEGENAWDENAWDTVTDLAPGAFIELPGICSIAPADVTPSISNGVIAEASITGSDVPVPVVLKDCIEADGICYATCEVDSAAELEVSKDCDVQLIEQDSYVVVNVPFSGWVLNSSDDPPTPLRNVTASDDKAGDLDLFWNPDLTGLYDPDLDLLLPGDALYFGGEYLPGTVNDDCAANATFSDTVTVDAENAFNASDAPQESSTADCSPCVDCVP